MRPDYLGVIFLTSAFVSFNGALWQVSRRRQKIDLLESHKNLSKEPLTDMPEQPLESYRPKDIEFRRVEWKGSFDNMGSVLVGPRNLPSYRGGTNADEQKSGFLVITPFEIAGSHKFVMVNRGWVPIDAGKQRRHLVQYTGDGFLPVSKLRGIFRKEEFIASPWGGDGAENHAPMAAGLSWLVVRPFDMIREYYSQRWGPDEVEQRVAAGGAPHYAVEMLEDYSGDDQRMVRGNAWPRRRDIDEVTYVALSPSTHSMYIAFWFFVSLGSLYGVKACFRRQQMIFAERKKVEKEMTSLLKSRQREAANFASAAAEVKTREEREKKDTLDRST